MSKQKLKEFVYDLIEMYEGVEESMIWEYSSNIDESKKELKEEIKQLQNEFEELLKHI